MTHEVVPVRNYVAVWAVLIILTFTTAWVAHIDLGPFNILVALTIAFIKMILVIVYFMHVKQADSLTRLFVVAGFVWMAIGALLTFSDYLSRGWLPPGHMW
jgi:cytochrome c oxidase subunit IV